MKMETKEHTPHHASEKQSFPRSAFNTFLKTGLLTCLLLATSNTWAMSTFGAISGFSGRVILNKGEQSEVITEPASIKNGDVIIVLEKSTAKVTQGKCQFVVNQNSLYTVRDYGSCDNAKTNIIGIDPSYYPQPVVIEEVRTSKNAVQSAEADVARLFDEPGVMTPRGSWVIEPTFSFSHSTATRVAINGFAIIPSLSIGTIEVKEVQRDSLNANFSFRYGLTNRIEVEARVPFTYKEQETRQRDLGVESSADSISDATGGGLGDVELTLHYQLNSVKPGKAYYLANLRFKSRTGKDSFQVKRKTLVNDKGEEIGSELTEEPTGSGFLAVQPSITAVLPADPAVLFSNISYLSNIARDINGVNIDPGDAIGLNFGVGFSVNPQTSFSLGYDHQIVLETKSEADTGLEARFKRITVGTLLFGISHTTQSGRAISVSLGIGATDQSPDMNLSIKSPFSL